MKLNFKRVLLFALMLFAFAGAANAAQTVPGDVLVIFNNGTQAKVSAASLKASGLHFKQASYAAAQLGASVKQVYSAISQSGNDIAVLIHSDSKDENLLLKELSARPDVKAASLNYIARPMAAPNDIYYDLLWGMRAIKADKVWDKGYTGSDAVYVAVIDSGLYLHHDLANNIDTQRSFGVDYETGNIITGESGFKDSSNGDIGYGHGTHTSGTIGAVGNNGIGVTGVNWNVKIIMGNSYHKFGDSWGFANSSTIAAINEIVRLKRSGVNIAALNMSIGGYERSAPSSSSRSSNLYWRALKAASDAGIIISVAAGNQDTRVGYATNYDDPNNWFKKGEYVYPASYLNIDNMIVVAAASHDAYGNMIRSSSAFSMGLEAGSNYGDKVDITAPGASIVSTTPNDYVLFSQFEQVEKGVVNYANWPGTSMAAPHVAGAAALLKSIYPAATAQQIKKAILEGANAAYCANDASDTRYYMYNEQVHDVTSKHGFLDIENALAKLGQMLGSTGDNTGDNTSDNTGNNSSDNTGDNNNTGDNSDNNTDDNSDDDSTDENIVDDNTNDNAVDDNTGDDNTNDNPGDNSTGDSLGDDIDIRPSWADGMSIPDFYNALFSGSRTFTAGTLTDTRSRYDADNPVKFKLATPLANDTYIYVRMTPAAYNNNFKAADAETVNAVMIASGDVIEVRPGKLYDPYNTSRLVEIDDGFYDIKVTAAGASAADNNAVALSARDLYFSEYDPYDYGYDYDDDYYDYDYDYDDDYYDYDDYDDYDYGRREKSHSSSGGCSSLNFGLFNFIFIAAALALKRRA